MRNSNACYADAVMRYALVAINNYYHNLCLMFKRNIKSLLPVDNSPISPT